MKDVPRGRGPILAPGAVVLALCVAFAWAKWRSSQDEDQPIPLVSARPANPPLAVGSSPSPLLRVPFDTAVVMISADHRYEPGTEEDTARLMAALPSRQIETAAVPLAAVIEREYGITADSAPGHYQVISRKIADANRLETPADAAAGTLLVPVLPRLSREAEPRQQIEVHATAHELRGFGSILLSRQSVEENVMPSARRTLITAELPLEAVATRAMAQLLARPENLLLSYPLDIVFAQPACAPPPYDVSFVDRTALREALRGGVAPATVFVVDSGWPDEESWRASRQYLNGVCADTRKRFRMERWGRDLRAQGAFRQQAAPAAGLRAHCQAVRSALREFEALTPHVHVVYVPLTLDQEAADVAAELMELHTIRGLLAIEKTPVEGLAGPTLDAIAFKAKGIVKPLAERLPVSPGAGGHTRVDGGLVSALLHVASMNGERTGRPFFVSESWWSPADTIPMDWPDTLMGFIVAATGNEPGRNVDNPVVLFAGHARRQPFILAALTLDRSGREACCTSIVDYTSPDLSAAGYYGVTDGRECGTSYVAPRVAWTLAARETLSASPLRDPVAWAGGIKARLRRLRGAGPPPASLMFDPVRYVSASP